MRYSLNYRFYMDALQNAGRRWNFSSSNVAGSVWGWTVN